MAVIGITGSIATGKSTFRDLLARHLSADVFDADTCAKSLLENDPDIRRRVTEALSARAYLPDGSADRVFIRSTIFNNPSAKARLEAILHPAVRATWTGLIEKTNGRHLLIDIPLLFETQADKILAQVVTVACTSETQLARLAKRGVDPVISARIVASQMPQAEKIARSQFVAWNDGSFEALDAQALLLAARVTAP